MQANFCFYRIYVLYVCLFIQLCPSQFLFILACICAAQSSDSGLMQWICFPPKPMQIIITVTCASFKCDESAVLTLVGAKIVVYRINIIHFPTNVLYCYFGLIAHIFYCLLILVSCCGFQLFDCFFHISTLCWLHLKVELLYGNNLAV